MERVRALKELAAVRQLKEIVKQADRIADVEKNSRICSTDCPPGDINGSGEVDLADAVIAMKILAIYQTETLACPEFTTCVADIDPADPGLAQARFCFCAAIE